MLDTIVNSSELSYPIEVDLITVEPTYINIIATPEECQALAKRFNLEGLSELEAKISLHRLVDNVSIRLSIDLKARVVQSCVVTLEPLSIPVYNHFEITLISSSVLQEKADLFEEDTAEPYEGKEIDVGEIVARYLYLSLDPYPRKKSNDLINHNVETEEKMSQPFKILEKFLEKKETKQNQ